MIEKALRTVRPLLLPVVILAAWQGASAVGWLDPAFIPPPSRIGRALVDLLVDGSLLGATIRTTLRALGGLFLTAVIGIPLGALIAASSVVDDLTRPVREFLRSLPTVVVIPAMMLILGFGDALSLAAIVFAAIWPTLLNTIHGINSVDPTLLNVARVHGFGPIRAAIKIRLPAALSPIVTGLRLSLAIALIVALVTEMIASNGGLGALVIEARSRFRSDDVFAIVAMTGIIGWAANGFMEWVEGRVSAPEA